MKRIIKSDILWEDKDEIMYTDEELIKCIDTLSSQVKGFNKIMMCFSRRNERCGEVLLYMLLEPHAIGNDMRYLTLHEIDLEEEDWKHYEEKGARFLFNVYVPMSDSTTTEIDVVMISHEGIFVFESKNYSGWIFGSEKQRNWTQVLPAGRGRSNKIQFYNPVRQNNTHIRELRKHVMPEAPIWSLIVFSERCTLKKVQIESNDVYVINRYNVMQAVNNICSSFNGKALNDNDIEVIYNTLYPYTQIDANIRRKHIENIRNRKELNR